MEFYYQSCPVDIDQILRSLNGAKIVDDSLGLSFSKPDSPPNRSLSSNSSPKEEGGVKKNRPFSNYKAKSSQDVLVTLSEPRFDCSVEKKKNRPFSNYRVKAETNNNISAELPKVVPKLNRPFSNYRVELQSDPISNTKSMPMLELENEDFPVKMGEIYNPKNFYLIRNDDNNDAYEDLKNRLNIFYSELACPQPVASVQVDDYYVGRDQQNDCHCRVQVLNRISPTLVLCCLCDEGRTTVLPIDGLFPLDDQFKHLPPRSFKASLSGKCQPVSGQFSILSFQMLKIDPFGQLPSWRISIRSPKTSHYCLRWSIKAITQSTTLPLLLIKMWMKNISIIFIQTKPPRSITHILLLFTLFVTNFQEIVQTNK